jgi:excisionase family DNA binding protein
MSARDAAAAAGVNERTIRRAIHRGDLAAGRDAGSYRIDPADLAAWMLARGEADTGPDGPHPAARHAAAPAADSGHPAPHPAAASGVAVEVVAELRARLAAAERDRDRWADEAAGLRTLLQQAQALALAERDRADALEARAVAARPMPAEVVDVGGDGPAWTQAAPGRAEPANAADDAPRSLWGRLRALLGG